MAEEERLRDSTAEEPEENREEEKAPETGGDGYPDCPKGTFGDVDESPFRDISGVFTRQLRDYQYFLRFRRYAPVTHFVDRPEKFSHTYEKQYWNLTLFHRICFGIRRRARHLATAPFSPGGDYPMFEREILNNPRSCPVYVARSRAIMEANIRRFKRVLYVTHRDVHNTMELWGNIPDDDHSNTIEVGRFLRSGRKLRTASEESDIPTTEIDRNFRPRMIAEEQGV